MRAMLIAFAFMAAVQLLLAIKQRNVFIALLMCLCFGLLWDTWKMNAARRKRAKVDPATVGKEKP